MMHGQRNIKLRHESVYSWCQITFKAHTHTRVACACVGCLVEVQVCVVSNLIKRGSCFMLRTFEYVIEASSGFKWSVYRCPRRKGQNFGRVFLMLNYTDINQNTYIQSWTVTEIMATEKCGLLGCPRTVSRPWRHKYPLRMPGNEKPLANIGMQWSWRDNEQLRPGYITWKPKDNYNSSASVFVCQFNAFMSLTSYFDVKYSY